MKKLNLHKTCAWHKCGKTFAVSASQFKIKRYCSEKHRIADYYNNIVQFEKPDEWRTCPLCKKEFPVWFKIRKNKFCSTDCSSKNMHNKKTKKAGPEAAITLSKYPARCQINRRKHCFRDSPFQLDRCVNYDGCSFTKKGCKGYEGPGDRIIGVTPAIDYGGQRLAYRVD